MQTKEFVKLLGIIYDKKTCDKCNEEVRYQIVLAKEWKSFIIPIYPVSKKYYLCCPKCGNRIEIEKTEARQYLDGVAHEKKDHQHKGR